MVSIWFAVFVYSPPPLCTDILSYAEFHGIRRIREVLETHDWADSPNADLDDDLEKELMDLDKGESGFSLEVDELQREMVGLRFAIEHGGGSASEDDEHDNSERHGANEEEQVESLEALMLRMKSMRGTVSFFDFVL